MILSCAKTGCVDSNRYGRDVSEKNVYAKSKKPSAAQSVREKKDVYVNNKKTNAAQSVREKNIYANYSKMCSSDEKRRNDSEQSANRDLSHIRIYLTLRRTNCLKGQSVRDVNEKKNGYANSKNSGD